jgi:hypothetical protein
VHTNASSFLFKKKNNDIKVGPSIVPCFLGLCGCGWALWVHGATRLVACTRPSGGTCVVFF